MSHRSLVMIGGFTDHIELSIRLLIEINGSELTPDEPGCLMSYVEY